MTGSIGEGRGRIQRGKEEEEVEREFGGIEG